LSLFYVFLHVVHDGREAKDLYTYIHIMAWFSYPSGDDYETPVSSLEDDTQEDEHASDAVAFARRVSHASQNTPKPQFAKSFYHGIDSADTIFSPQIDELLKTGIKSAW